MLWGCSGGCCGETGSPVKARAAEKLKPALCSAYGERARRLGPRYSVPGWSSSGAAPASPPHSSPAAPPLSRALAPGGPAAGSAAPSRCRCLPGGARSSLGGPPPSPTGRRSLRGAGGGGGPRGQAVVSPPRPPLALPPRGRADRRGEVRRGGESAAAAAEKGRFPAGSARLSQPFSCTYGGICTPAGVCRFPTGNRSVPGCGGRRGPGAGGSSRR